MLVTPVMSSMTDHLLQNGTRRAYLKLDHKSIIIALNGVYANRALNLIMKRCFRRKMVGSRGGRGQGNYLKHHKLYAWAYLVTGWVLGYVLQRLWLLNNRAYSVHVETISLVQPVPMHREGSQRYNRLVWTCLYFCCESMFVLLSVEDHRRLDFLLVHV